NRGFLCLISTGLPFTSTFTKVSPIRLTATRHVSVKVYPGLTGYSPLDSAGSSKSRSKKNGNNFFSPLGPTNSPYVWTLISSEANFELGSSPSYQYFSTSRICNLTLRHGGGG